MSTETGKQYVRKRRKCCHPNLLFKKWLMEWKADAVEKNSNMQYNFHRALKSLELYPLPLYSGDDCKILSNFGEKLCAMINRKLRTHVEENGQIDWDDFIKIVEPKKKKARNSLQKKIKDKSSETPNKSILKTKRTYIPAYRSGAYGILVALYNAAETANYKGFLKKEELISLGQDLCDSSFSIPPNGSHYTAWSSMSTLIKKGLVFKCGSPARYTITDEGTDLVKQILNQQCIDITNSNEDHTASTSRSIVNNQSNKNLPASSFHTNVHYLSDSDIEDINIVDDELPVDTNVPNGLQRKCMQLHRKKEPVRQSVVTSVKEKPLSTAEKEITSVSSNYTLPPGSFKIILCVDSAETAGGFKSGKKNMKDVILTELTGQGVDFDVRKLHIGDFLWIAQELAANQKKRELVLPFIVERKRMDDLASSILDGRFREQKFRLKQSGLNKTIYLVEEYGSNHTSIPLSTCEQAIANTQVIDGFQIKLTTDIRDSVSYLNSMTKYLQRKFQNTLMRCLPKESISQDGTGLSNGSIDLMDFGIFNSLSMKNKQLSVKDMFTKQLLQLNGLSIDKAAAIVEKYPTPRSLIAALNNCCTPSDLLSTLKCSRSGRMIGPRISSTIAQLYTSNNLT